MISNFQAAMFYRACEKISTGRLTVISPDGQVDRFGQGGGEAVMDIHDWNVLKAVLTRGDIGLGEAYVEGLWDSPDVEALVRLFLNNQELVSAHEQGSLLNRLVSVAHNQFLCRNSRKGSRKNIAAHYDVGNDFYRLWLDETMTYSSALFNEGDDLVTAQKRKYERLLQKARPGGDRILEIGCGWGGFAEHAANAGCNLTGVTISQSQHDYANRRLGDKANIELRDYRDVKGKFDAIVSIEMIEAVGMKYWPQYFRTLKSRLNAGGKIALQAIIVEDERFDTYARRSDFIRKYTFPGGMLISPGKIRENAQAAGLKVDEIFRFGKDYARTLREWLMAFQAQEEKIRAMGYNDSFIRSWRYYLQICAAAFETNRNTNVAHIELSHA